MIPIWLAIVIFVTAAVAYAMAFVMARKLYQWERQLSGVRIQVNFKGKAKMTPRLIDWLVWANQLQGDKRVNGQVIYSQGGTTIALRKAPPRDHGKATTTTIKERGNG